MQNIPDTNLKAHYVQLKACACIKSINYELIPAVFFANVNSPCCCFHSVSDSKQLGEILQVLYYVSCDIVSDILVLLVWTASRQ
jgi:hypothetical protein